MGDSSDLLTSQFEVYVQQYQSTSKSIMSGASAQFRDASSLETGLTDLKATFQKADQAIEKYGAEKTPLSSTEELQLNALGSQLKTQIEAVIALFPPMQSADLKYIQSAKVATLDQPDLKALEAKLKVVDDTLSKNLTSMIPPGPGDEPAVRGQDIIDPNTDGDDIENIPDAEEIALIDG